MRRTVDDLVVEVRGSGEGATREREPRWTLPPRRCCSITTSTRAMRESRRISSLRPRRTQHSPRRESSTCSRYTRPCSTRSFWVRGLPAKILRRPDPPAPEKLTLDGDLALPGWMVLDESPGREIVFGAIGVFWTPTIRWNTDVEAHEFAEFDEPGWGKIACNYSALPYGEHRTLLTYECRTVTTDADSRRLFKRYWWLIRPFVEHIMNATVRTIGEHAGVPYELVEAHTPSAVTTTTPRPIAIWRIPSTTGTGHRTAGGDPLDHHHGDDRDRAGREARGPTPTATAAAASARPSAIDATRPHVDDRPWSRLICART